MPERTTCAIAGCGPAGAMLGLLLARAGVETVVLEKHADFLRDFRGDTIHPSTLDVMDELGLLDELLSLPHQKASRLYGLTDDGRFALADFGRLRLRHPYVAFVPQWEFLSFVTKQARRLPSFTLRTEAEAHGLVEEHGRVAGLRYRTSDGADHELRAALTVAADGRDSGVRRAAGMEPISFGAPMDVLWFRLTRVATDPDEFFGRLGAGRFLALINRGDYWQIAWVIAKGSLAELRRGPIDTLREELARLLPFLADRVEEVGDWKQLSLLNVQVNRLRRWHRPGLLCLGDAAHAMSPMGGVGINLAVQDAVAAANRLWRPLREGTLADDDLAAVQRRRTLPTVVTQGMQRVMQRAFLAPVLSGRAGAATPRGLRLLARFPALQAVPARLIGVGVRPEHVAAELRPTG